MQTYLSLVKRDVIEAVAAGTFHVCAIDTVDEGLKILTGVRAGRRDVTGAFPEGTCNGRVERRLIALARQARAFKLAGDLPGDVRAPMESAAT